MTNELLNTLREKYIKNLTKIEKLNHYFKLGEISYFNIKKNGIKNFRETSSGVGLGYSDSILLDANVTSNFFKRFIYYLINLFSFGKFFNEQKTLNKRLFDDLKEHYQFIYQNNKKVKNLIKRYKIENSTLFNCKTKVQINKKFYSIHYLEICNKMNFINESIRLDKIYSYCEIGGGFGSNIHLIQQNFKNIKKFLLIDIFPTIYVATKYLQEIYGDAVITYDKLSNKNEIRFSDNDKLEIICLPNWEIEKFKSKIEHFHNGDSFSHLPMSEIKKYLSFLHNSSIKSFSINDLDSHKYKKTSPHKYIRLFNKKIKPKYNDYIISGLRDNKNLYYIGKLYEKK